MYIRNSEVCKHLAGIVGSPGHIFSMWHFSQTSCCLHMLLFVHNAATEPHFNSVYCAWKNSVIEKIHTINHMFTSNNSIITGAKMSLMKLSG